MAFRIVNDTATSSVRLASRRVQPCPATRLSAQELYTVDVSGTIAAARRCAAPILLSAGLACELMAEPAMAIVDLTPPQPASSVAASPRQLQLLPEALPSPLPLASTVVATAGATSASGGAALVVAEAEELVADVASFFQHSVEAVQHGVEAVQHGVEAVQHGVEVVESTVHHLQVVHALERLEGMPLNQVVDLKVLKAAMHPAGVSSSHGAAVSFSGDDGGEEVAEAEEGSSHQAAAIAAARRFDAALDAVAEWRLRDVVDVGKLADALQDVQYSGPLESRALQREALRLRRTVHWEAVAEALRPRELRQALAELGAAHRGGSPFSEMDIRAAMSAVRMDAVQQVLSPPKTAQQPSHSLESSGMWTWDSV